MTRPLIDQLAKATGMPNDPELAVRINGAVMAGAGALFAAGKLPRTSAALLAASMVPTTYVGHAFWKETDPQAKQMQRLQFLKNASMIGSLLLAAVDTDGKPGVAYRSKMAKVEAGRAADRSKRTAVRAARQARKDARRDAELLKLRAQASLPTS